MSPIGRRTALKFIAGSVAGGMTWSAAPWARAATVAPSKDQGIGDVVLGIASTAACAPACRHGASR